MKITIYTTEGKQNEVEVIQSFYYSIAGKRVKFHIHRSLNMRSGYTITHAKSARRVMDYPEYGYGYYGNTLVRVAKAAMKALIDERGEDRVNAVLIKAERYLNN